MASVPDGIHSSNGGKRGGTGRERHGRTVAQQSRWWGDLDLVNVVKLKDHTLLAVLAFAALGIA